MAESYQAFLHLPAVAPSCANPRCAAIYAFLGSTKCLCWCVYVWACVPSSELMLTPCVVCAVENREVTIDMRPVRPYQLCCFSLNSTHIHSRVLATLRRKEMIREGLDWCGKSGSMIEAIDHKDGHLANILTSSYAPLWQSFLPACLYLTDVRQSSGRLFLFSSGRQPESHVDCDLPHNLLLRAGYLASKSH